MNVNKVMIYGNITRDPESRQLPSGVGVTNLAVATNRYYTNQQNEKVEEVEYHNVVLFGRLSELAQEYLKKGSGVFIEGRLRTSSWEADGVKKYKTEIIGENMQFGPRRNTDGGGASSTAGRQPESSAKAAPPAANQQEPTINPDDIPF